MLSYIPWVIDARDVDALKTAGRVIYESNWHKVAEKCVWTSFQLE